MGVHAPPLRPLSSQSVNSPVTSATILPGIDNEPNSQIDAPPKGLAFARIAIAHVIAKGEDDLGYIAKARYGEDSLSHRIAAGGGLAQHSHVNAEVAAGATVAGNWATILMTRKARLLNFSLWFRIAARSDELLVCAGCHCASGHPAHVPTSSTRRGGAATRVRWCPQPIRVIYRSSVWRWFLGHCVY